MKEIEVIGSEKLTQEEEETANKIINNFYPKIERIVKAPLSLKIYIKEYEKDGKGKKYSIDLEIRFSGKKMTSSSFSYDLSKAVRDSLTKIENEIEHKFHSSEQH